jgi:hypothetical protein
VALLLTLWLAPGRDQARPERARPSDQDRKAFAEYRKVIDDTVAMANPGSDAQRLAARHGLHVLNLTWEDTGCFKGSAVGPNISDMTIQVQQLDPAGGQARVSRLSGVSSLPQSCGAITTVTTPRGRAADGGLAPG